MAIRCPSCGREYDVSLFEFGRTVQCACGARVGLELRGRPLAEDRRFITDAMLGRLARWLRALGYDVAADPPVADADLVRRAVLERRVLLTRDRRLCRDWWISGCVVVEARRPARQLDEVMRRLGLDRRWRRQLFTRCLVCNTPLVPASHDEVAAQLPTPAPAGPYSRCPGCGRVFWEGQHTRRMRRFLERALEEGDAP